MDSNVHFNMSHSVSKHMPTPTVRATAEGGLDKKTRPLISHKVDNRAPKLTANATEQGIVDGILHLGAQSRGLKTTKASLVPIYEYYNAAGGDHEYTPRTTPYDKNWVKNGIAFYAYSGSVARTVAIYQHYNGANRDHEYVTRSTPYDKNWGKPGVAFYAYSHPLPGTVPIYQYYNSASMDHEYTPRDTPFDSSWAKNGIVFYAYNNPDSATVSQVAGLRYWLDDGCHTEKKKPKDDLRGRYVNENEAKGGARCCNNNAYQCTTHIKCEKTKWTFAEADAHCAAQAAGSRLCTKEELLSEMCCNSGGKCNNYPVWTSTPQEVACSNPHTPHGGTNSRLMYQHATVTEPAACQEETQKRTCYYGGWTEWKGVYTNPTCTVQTTTTTTVRCTSSNIHECLSAYMSDADCGSRKKNQHWDWCAKEKGECKRYINTGYCKSQRAELVEVQGTGESNSVNVEGCNYAYFAQYDCLEDGATDVVPQEGLVAWFRQPNQNQDAKKWKSEVGNFNGQVVGGEVETKCAEGHGATMTICYLEGTTSTEYMFGPIIKPYFTICSLSRYAGFAKQRILKGDQGNWFHGHWKGNAGSVFYQNWKNKDHVLSNQDDWVALCATNTGESRNRVYLNGQVYPTYGAQVAGTGDVELSINHGQFLQLSDWAVAEVITWDRGLTAAEMRQASDYLYGYLSQSQASGTNIQAIPAAGLVSWFKTEGYKGQNHWFSETGSFVGKVTKGTVAKKCEAGYGAQVSVCSVQGTKTDAYDFGHVIKDQFTICSMTRYTGPTIDGRILQGSRTNWLHGHWRGATGVAYYGSKWKGSEYNVVSPKTNWVLMCASNTGQIKNKRYVNGQVLDGTGSADGNQDLVINAGPFSWHAGPETTDWAVMEVMTWNRGLSETESSKVMLYMQTKLIDLQGLPQQGLVSWFSMGNYKEGKDWKSSVGAQAGKVLGGTVEKYCEPGHGAPNPVCAIKGDYNAQYSFGPIIPSEFTICSMTRFTDSRPGRILQGLRTNWLHAHYLYSVGIAYYEGWKGQASNRVTPVTDWVLMCGSNAGEAERNLYVNGQVITNSGGGTRGDEEVVINTGVAGAQNSNWAVGEVITWNRGLTHDEMLSAMAHMQKVLEEGIFGGTERTDHKICKRPGTGYNFVNMEADGQSVLATAYGEVKEVDAEIGSISSYDTPTVLVGYGHDKGERVTEPANLATAGQEFVIRIFRKKGDPQTLVLFAVEAADVRVKENGAVIKKYSLVQGTFAYLSGNFYQKVIEIAASGKILVSHEANDADYLNVVPASQILYGSPTRYSWITVYGGAPATISEACSDGSTRTWKGSATYNVKNDNGVLGAGKACKWTAPEGVKIGGHAWADGNGEDGVAFLPAEYNQFVTPLAVDMKYVKLIGNQQAKCSFGEEAVILGGDAKAGVYTYLLGSLPKGTVIACDKPVQAFGDDATYKDEHQIITVASPNMKEQPNYYLPRPVPNGTKWYMSDAFNQSCSATCAEIGLQCKSGSLHAHNADVADSAHVEPYLGSLMEGDCKSMGFSSTAQVAPYLSRQGRCFWSDSSRAEDTYSCDATSLTAARLCYCEAVDEVVQKYERTKGKCYNGQSHNSKGHGKCLPQPMTAAQCAKACDDFSQCRAYDRLETEGASECCLYTFGNTGEIISESDKMYACMVKDGCFPQVTIFGAENSWASSSMGVFTKTDGHKKSRPIYAKSGGYPQYLFYSDKWYVSGNVNSKASDASLLSQSSNECPYDISDWTLQGNAAFTIISEGLDPEKATVFSKRASGFLNMGESGDFKFETQGVGAYKLFVGDMQTPLITKDKNGCATGTCAANKTLDVGLVEFKFEATGYLEEARMFLKFTTPSGKSQPVDAIDLSGPKIDV